MNSSLSSVIPPVVISPTINTYNDLPNEDNVITETLPRSSDQDQQSSIRQKEKLSPLPMANNNIIIQGRRYQNYNDRYRLPNDDMEMDRLLNNHLLVKYCFGSNYSAPITELLSAPRINTLFHTQRAKKTTKHKYLHSTIPVEHHPSGVVSLQHPTSHETSQHNDTTFTSSPEENMFIPKKQQEQSSSPPRGKFMDYLRKWTKLRKQKEPANSSATKKTRSASTGADQLQSTPLTKTNVADLSPIPHRRHYSESDTQQTNGKQRSSISTTSRLCTHYPDINICRVLDIACGNGVWILDMAHEFPNVEFYGFDISEVFPTSIRPKNAYFKLFDMNQGIPYPDSFFDFIRMHDVLTCFASNDIKFIILEIRRCLKPGGYVELRELDPTISNAGPITSKFTSLDSKIVKRLQDQYNVDLSWPLELNQHLQDHHLVDIHSQTVRLPFGHQPPTCPLLSSRPPEASLIRLTCWFWKDRCDAYQRLLLEAYNETEKELDQQMKCMLEEMMDRSSYCQYYMAWARKPLVDDYCYQQNNNDDEHQSRKNSHNTAQLSVSSSRSDLSSMTDEDIMDDIYDLTDGYID
ncbi:uncharacterized protein BX664DRAFT_337711, partial [Halteromyces radiatus]|uniref:uncharacterized protein n=1 Tax=Halteromyces radiatus TaxID=101107 RepID=UPI00221FDF3E